MRSREGGRVSVAYTWHLPADSTAPAQGRWHVRGLSSSDVDAIDAELVVSELITNAWKHGSGAGDITLQVEVRDDCLHIDVCGITHGTPLIDDVDSGIDASGRGLLLIEELASRWGYERRGDVMCVWADVPYRA